MTDHLDLFGNGWSDCRCLGGDGILAAALAGITPEPCPVHQQAELDQHRVDEARAAAQAHLEQTERIVAGIVQRREQDAADAVTAAFAEDRAAPLQSMALGSDALLASFIAITGAELHTGPDL